MPFLKHIVGPLLQRNTNALKQDLGPPNALVKDVEAARDFQRQIDESQRNGRGSFQRGFEEGTSTYAGYLKNDPKYLEPETYGAAEPPSAPPLPSERGFTQIRTPAPQIESYDPRIQEPMFNYGAAVGSLPSTGGWLAFKRGAMGMYPVPQVGSVPEPVSPAAPPIVSAPATPAKTDKKGRPILDLPKSGPVGVAEDGQAIDRYGKKLGYMAQQQEGIRFADRQAGDFTLEDRDPAAQDRFKALYGPHLKELEDNNGKFPAGYFKKMSADDKQNIIKGVQYLQQLERGTRT